ncbi:glycosyltransferase family 4 protein [Candidatus Shapirobacteria bacterium]|nr:glycosyltransferase family 4 protein [Candidatus Shapirobacteria bacterium]
MANKKILLGLTYYLPNISGVTQYAVILSEELVKRNYEVGVICSGKNRIWNKINIFGVDGFCFGKGYIMPLYFWESFKLVQRYDIINCHLPSLESFWLALWGKLFNKKIVVTHHCEFNFTGTVSNKFISLVTYPIHLVVYILADEVVSYTMDYGQTSIFVKHFLKKTVFILPPIKIDGIKNQNSKVKSKNKIVGFVGRIAWEKGLNYLAEAMKQIDAKLMLVGPYKSVAGDETYKKLTNVELIGPVEHDKLNKYYELFDCLVLPSTNNLETFGIVQAEAMRCGCPVVASDLPGVRVPVKMTGMGEIAKVADSVDLAEKINIVLKNGKKYYQKIAKNLDKFDYKKTVNEYEKIFDAK